jgi:hypothetical protein
MSIDDFMEAYTSADRDLDMSVKMIENDFRTAVPGPYKIQDSCKNLPDPETPESLAKLKSTQCTPK